MNIDKSILKEAKLFEQITLKPNGLNGNSVADVLLVWKEFNVDLDLFEYKGICIDAKIRSGEPYEQFIEGAPYTPNQKGMVDRGRFDYEVRTSQKSIEALNDINFTIKQGVNIEIINFLKAPGDISSTGIPSFIKEF